MRLVHATVIRSSDQSEDWLRREAEHHGPGSPGLVVTLLKLICSAMTLSSLYFRRGQSADKSAHSKSYSFRHGIV